MPTLFAGEAAVGLLMLIWLFTGIVVIGLLVLFSLGRKHAAQASAAVAYLVESNAELERIHAAENGVRWLEQIRIEHPLLVYAPTAESVRPAAAQVVERQTIERQVVVARCRYCAKLTPVDHPRCGNCGADGPV